MNWIKIQGKYYNSDYFRKIYYKDNSLYIEYSNGDVITLYHLNNRDKIVVNKIVNNDSKADSRVI